MRIGLDVQCVGMTRGEIQDIVRNTGLGLPTERQMEILSHH